MMTGNVQRHLMRALGGTPGQPGRRAPDPTSDRPLVVLLIAGLVLAMAAGTQYFAWRADFPPAFGAPLFVLSAHAVRLLQVAGVLTLASAMVVLTFPRLRWLAGPLLLGREGRKLLRLAGEGHILTVAPTRSGKGVSAVIPNLLDHPGSIIATDPKGENFAV